MATEPPTNHSSSSTQPEVMKHICQCLPWTHVYVCVCLLSLLCLQNFHAAPSPGSLNMYAVVRWTCFLHLPPLSGDFNILHRNKENLVGVMLRYVSCFILTPKTPISNSISSQILLGHFSQGCEVHLSLSHELEMHLITASAVSSNTLRNPNMYPLLGKLLKNDLGGCFQWRSMAIYN